MGGAFFWAPVSHSFRAGVLYRYLRLLLLMCSLCLTPLAGVLHLWGTGVSNLLGTHVSYIVRWCLIRNTNPEGLVGDTPKSGVSYKTLT